MISKRIVVAAAAVALALGTAAPDEAQEPGSSRPDLRSLFPRRAEIFLDRPGMTRLLLPPEVLAECQAELSDLRVIDRHGREVPYLVDGGPPPDAVFEERVTFVPAVVAAYREIVERDEAPEILRESYHLALPEGEPRHWQLMIESGRSRFVRRFEVRAASGGEEGEPIASGSVFRLQDPPRERLTATLPLLDADHLVVTLEGEEEGYLEPRFRLEASRVLPDREQVRVDLTILEITSRDGRTVVELERPRALVPDRLAVATATGSFNRHVQVTDRGAGSTAGELGSTTLFRLEGAEDVQRLEVPLRPAAGDVLRVAIDDGDSPPLEALTFQGALRSPALVFDLGAVGAGGPAGELLFGGARAYRPRYDLATLLATGRRGLDGEAAQIAVVLRDPDRLGTARLGPVGANPLWDPGPALAFAMRPGTRIAAWRYQHRRPLPVPETGEGLLRLKLGAETVARCRTDLADLRLVDSEGRQWPYLLERSGRTERVPLAVRRTETSDGTSVYTLELPATPLPVQQLLLDGPAPYFDRPFELRGTPAGRGKQPRGLVRGRLTRRPDDSGELDLAVGAEPVVDLELRVEDGDDPPLEWSSVAVQVPVAELYFAAPEGDYDLLFGDPEARRPRYELAQVRDLVLAVESTAVEAGPLAENPGQGAFARFRGQGGWQQVLLWSALILAALVLAWITLRLARQDQA